MFARRAQIVFAVSTSLGAAALTGCGMNNMPLSVGSSSAATANVQGTVHGGQQPIVGAHVYLMAVGTGGYGGPGVAASTANASTSLLTSGTTGTLTDAVGTYVTTDANGAFSLGGKYTCTAGGNAQMYVLALGGYGAQTGNATANAASGLMAAVGPCTNPATKVSLNEVTTVAAAYAFAGFASDSMHISSSGSALALTNLANAYTNASTLVNVATGVPNANTATVAVPAPTIYTLADILASCVNSGGGAQSTCPTLFSYTMSGGATGTAATETATAAIHLAHNPYPTAAGVTALYGLVPGTAAPYAGGLAAQPNDFTLGLDYLVFTGAGFPGVNNAQITIDAGGKAWVLANGAAPSGGTGGTNSAVISVAPGGAVTAYNGYAPAGTNTTITPAIANLQQPAGTAFDGNGNLWIPDESATAANTFDTYEVTSGFVGIGTSPYALPTAPYSVAIAGGGNAWFGTPMLSELNTSGVPVAGSPFAISSQYAGLAFDGTSTLWVATPGTPSGAALTRVGSSGTQVGTTTTAGTVTPQGIAIDHNNNVWVSGGSALVEVASNGTIVTGSPFASANSASSFNYDAVDGAGNVWTVDMGSTPTTVVFSNSGVEITPQTGYQGGAPGGFAIPAGVAVDGSGDVWVSYQGGNTVQELIGAATPVVTPIVANLIAPYTAPASKP